MGHASNTSPKLLTCQINDDDNDCDVDDEEVNNEEIEDEATTLDSSSELVHDVTNLTN